MASLLGTARAKRLVTRAFTTPTVGTRAARLSVWLRKPLAVGSCRKLCIEGEHCQLGQGSLKILDGCQVPQVRAAKRPGLRQSRNESPPRRNVHSSPWTALERLAGCV